MQRLRKNTRPPSVHACRHECIHIYMYSVDRGTQHMWVVSSTLLHSPALIYCDFSSHFCSFFIIVSNVLLLHLFIVIYYLFVIFMDYYYFHFYYNFLKNYYSLLTLFSRVRSCRVLTGVNTCQQVHAYVNRCIYMLMDPHTC